MRHKKVEKRIIEADKIYNSILVAKFINCLMKSGKKNAAQRVLYETFDILSKDNHKPMEVFDLAIQNAGPRQIVKAKRVGGASYQIPVEVKSDRKISLAIRWIIEAASGKSNKDYKTFAGKLASELLDASRGLGGAVKKKEMVYKMAESNRAFSHFRF